MRGRRRQTRASRVVAGAAGRHGWVQETGSAEGGVERAGNGTQGWWRRGTWDAGRPSHRTTGGQGWARTTRQYCRDVNIINIGNIGNLENVRVDGRLVPPVALDDRRIEGGHRAGRSQGGMGVGNTVQNSGSPGLDLGNLVLSERSGEPRGREPDIALVDVDMVLEVPWERYAVVVGTGLVVLGGERVGDLGEQGGNGELVLRGHDGRRRRRRDMRVLVVLRRRRRALVTTTQKPERHHQRKTIKYTFSVIPLGSHAL